MKSGCFADRLGEWMTLTDGERTALARLEDRERRLRRGAVLIRENDPLGDLYVLKQGMMMSYVLLDDGSRQILRFIFPGDLLAVSTLVYRVSPDTIAALTDCVVAPFERAQLAELMVGHPRLGAAILAMTQMERVMCTARMAAIGRTSAKARVALLLLEIRDRLQVLSGTDDATFTPGVTQEEIGDATGLTAVHVNRMLRQLEDEGLIARDNGRVTLLDEPMMKRTASYIDRFAGVDLGWLPPAMG